MNSLALKMAVSPLVLALATAGCSTAPKPSMFQPVAASPKAASAEQQASRSIQLAQQMIQRGETSQALGHVEKAVELSPRDSGYRMLLGDLYLKNGRFLSAESAFADVLMLDPSNGRAMFNLVLAQIALGKKHTAIVKLDHLAQTLPFSDVGLAYALAGDPDRAVTMLEAASRSADADGRVRQNLALAYALSGDWQRARITASQDLSPADLATRMEQWARFVQPAAQWDQVASLLGVTPAQDPGQPVRLALAPPAPEAPAHAEMQPQPAPEAPVAYADLEEPLEAPPVQVHYNKPVPAEAPRPKAVQASLPAPTAKPSPAKKLVQEPRPAATGRFVVQLASYDSVAALSEGWSQLRKRYALGSASPVSAVVDLPGKGKFHRLSLSGFDSQAEAARACAAIKGKGGACFVRAASGDVPMQWASR
ncbi:MAG TPA: SPOR domain-containing protein [Allosphingosinicella sp.]|nr:SPOR domain-containing protein [Allosphingosinicella sp.]